MRINHFIASAGICSRRKADEMVKAGMIKVNNLIIREVGLEISLTDVVEVNKSGIWSIISTPATTITYAVNKPAGYTSTAEDRFAKNLVIDLVPKNPRVFTIGRLDKDSEGLILLTNDGDLTNRLTHPSNHVQKTYIAIIGVPPKYDTSQISANLSKLESGVFIDNRKTAQSYIRLTHPMNKLTNTFEVKITLSEGRNRQIRKMFQKIGLNVLKLTRIAIGGLELKSLKIATGKYKILNSKELSLLK
jgi:23S rRNA pseudouridine2605 synthase